MRNAWLTAAALLTVVGGISLLPVASEPADASTTPPPVRDLLEVSGLRLLADDIPAPADVVVGGDGKIYVLDGQGVEIHVMDPASGTRTVLTVSGAPVGLGWGGGRLWTARSDVPVVMSWAPGDEQWIERLVDIAEPDARLTDVTVVSDQVIAVANYGGPYAAPVAGGEWRLLELDPVVGMGFLCAASGGRFAVGDIQHYQVVLSDLDGDHRRDLGAWGVWEGNLVHPTGIAIDDRDRIFVADGRLGVIQAFDEEGAFLGALGQEGKLLRLEHPTGVAVAGDTVYLLDWAAGRVLAAEVEGRTRPLTPVGLYQRKVPRISYLEGQVTPKAMLGPVCQSCHDGSVMSSAHVWDSSLTSHPADVAPEKEVPSPFTLDEEGKLYCGTCHIPHRMAADPGGHAEPAEVFLKEPRARSELCLACHTDVVAEVRHVAGPIPDTEDGHLVGVVPRAKRHRGVRAIADDVEAVECLDCHSPHGAYGEMLMGRDAASEGCIECHVGVAPDAGLASHPVDRPLGHGDVVTKLTERGVFVGPGQTVACLTCHDVHRSGERANLTETLSDNERCVLCHRSQAALQGGAHDLRAGRGGHLATACLECHTVHDAAGPALGRVAGALRDPTSCLGCHERGGSADSHIDPDGEHPLFERNEWAGRLPSVGPEGSLGTGMAGTTSCLTCHDPHASPRAGNPAMLRRPGGDAGTCLACHPETGMALRSDHDLRLTPSPLSVSLADEMESSGFCLACHGLHDGGDWQQWKGPRFSGATGNPATMAVWAATVRATTPGPASSVRMTTRLICS